MALLPTSKRISKEDVPGSPGWVAPLLAGINTFFLAIWDALSGNITFGENITCQIKEISFTTSEDYSIGDWVAVSFLKTLKTKAQAVVLLQILQDEETYTPVLEAVTVHNWLDVNGYIKIYHIPGLEDETTY